MTGLYWRDWKLDTASESRNTFKKNHKNVLEVSEATPPHQLCTTPGRKLGLDCLRIFISMVPARMFGLTADTMETDRWRRPE